MELTVEKSAPETAVVGESIRYSIDVVRNDSRVPVDQFTLHDTLPDNVNMTSLYTGTYNASVSMNALYKTNLSSDWKIWRENMSSSTGVELTTASLNLKENKYVTEFAIDYGTVPAGFSAKEGDTPYYYVTIGKADIGTNFVNHIELTGYVNGEKLESSDSTVTKITNARKTPQTGDDNRWFGFFLAMLIIALIALGTYIAVMRSKKKQIHDADDEEEPKKRLFPKKVPNVPLSELVKKK